MSISDPEIVGSIEDTEMNKTRFLPLPIEKGKEVIDTLNIV
jgi:hypothetical protein